MQALVSRLRWRLPELGELEVESSHPSRTHASGPVGSVCIQQHVGREWVAASGNTWRF